MDTRTASRPRRDAAEEIAFASVKVPSDPARLNTTTASFRVRFTPPAVSLIEPAVPLAAPNAELVMPALVAPAAAPRRQPRVRTITWAGEAAPLLAAAVAGPATVPPQGGPSLTPGQDTTQVLVLPDYETELGAVDLAPIPAPDPDRGDWHPRRRVDLGLVLLPLRILLGCISVWAGFSKLCDPVYFDGGARGSMMHWLQSLHPWSAAEPLLQVALTHPVGAGLAVAFTQIVCGVLAILGLWMRPAAAATMALSGALLVTVAWQSVPAYDAPEFIYLVAWSPLLLAGAPMFSLDGWLALDAWRKLGERASTARLRRRVLRRGVVLTTLVVGTAMVLGSMLGAAVRTSKLESATVPENPATPSGTQYPSPVWPSGTLPASGTTAGQHGKAGKKPRASASASPHASATARHHAGGGASSSAGSTTTKSSSSGGSSPRSSSSGSTKHSSSPKPAPTSSGNNGVIGGLLGGH